MKICTRDIPTARELDRLGDDIAERSATAHLLELIREFDAREGWNRGSRLARVRFDVPDDGLLDPREIGRSGRSREGRGQVQDQATAEGRRKTGPL